MSGGIASFAADPGKAIGSAASAVWNGVSNAVGSTVDRIGKAWERGDFHELGRMTGAAAANVGLAVLPVGTVLGAAARVARFARLGEVAGEATCAVRATRLFGDAGAGLRTAASEIRGRAGRFFDDVFNRAAGCMNRCSARTLVATAAGAVAIGSLAPGDRVLAYDEALTPRPTRVPTCKPKPNHERVPMTRWRYLDW